MIVVDSSVLVEALVTAGAARARIGSEQIIAPHLVDVEVGHALRRMTFARELDTRVARSALQQLAEMEILRYPHTLLLSRAWELRANVSMYDAIYVALAEGLDIPLVTLDKALASIPGSRGRVEVLGST